MLWLCTKFRNSRTKDRLVLILSKTFSYQVHFNWFREEKKMMCLSDDDNIYVECHLYTIKYIF